MVEFGEDEEALHQYPKRSEPINQSQFPSTSMEDSSFIIPILPAELITEILLRLPVKSLLKFRSVAKYWLVLISSPEFIKTHLSLSANNKDFTYHRLMLMFNQPENNLKDCSVSSLLYDSVTEAFDLEYPMKKPSRLVKIVGSVNGLICLVIAKKYLFIWNPSIRKFKKLPDCTDGFSSRYSYMYGFGYDELHDDYKVVVGLDNLKNCHCFRVQVRIYSVNSDSWTSIDDFNSRMLEYESGMFVNGKLHWVNNETYCFCGWDIISVDLADMKWGKVEQPYYGELGEFDWMLGVVGSDLSVFCDYQRTHTDVWVMKEYGVKESWMKMFTINVPSDPMGYQLCPFFCKRGILFQFGSAFMIYNPNDDSITHLTVTNTIYDYEANAYIESLVWPFIMENTKEAASTEKVEKARKKMKTIVNE